MKPLVVGIAGGTASGKSTLAHALAERLGERCLLLAHDRYYHPLPALLRPTPVLHNFDHPASLDSDRLAEDLEALRSGRPARLPVYDFARHDRAPHQEEVAPRPVIVVEGILVLAHAPLRAVFDHRVYVHAPDDVRLARRIRRDLAKRGRTVEQILDQYERTVRPMHERYVAPSRAHADLVLDGTLDLDTLLEPVLALRGVRG